MRNLINNVYYNDNISYVSIIVFFIVVNIVESTLNSQYCRDIETNGIRIRQNVELISVPAVFHAIYITRVDEFAL